MREKGKPNPLDEAPAFDLEERWFISAYRRLNESKIPRQVAGFNPIPISEFAAYFSLFGSLYELDITIDIIQEIDKELYKYMSKIHESKRKAEEKIDEEPQKGKFGPRG